MINPTLQQVIDAGTAIGITKADAKEFYEHYLPQGWKWGNNVDMCPPLQACLVRWRNNRHKYKNSKQKLFPIKGKFCCHHRCGMPAVYREAGDFGDSHYCADHMPEKVRDKYA